jgi:alkyl hydroperoxide reductase subunit AhpF
VTEEEDIKWRAKVDNELGNQTRELGNQTHILKKLDYAINGNGVPGLKMDVDRLKQTAARKAKIDLAVITVVIGLVAKAAWALMFHP